jgi:hypothetical protein
MVSPTVRLTYVSFVCFPHSVGEESDDSAVFLVRSNRRLLSSHQFGYDL